MRCHVLPPPMTTASEAASAASGVGGLVGAHEVVAHLAEALPGHPGVLVPGHPHAREGDEEEVLDGRAEEGLDVLLRPTQPLLPHHRRVAHQQQSHVAHRPDLRFHCTPREPCSEGPTPPYILGKSQRAVRVPAPRRRFGRGSGPSSMGGFHGPTSRGLLGCRAGRLGGDRNIRGMGRTRGADARFRGPVPLRAKRGAVRSRCPPYSRRPLGPTVRHPRGSGAPGGHGGREKVWRGCRTSTSASRGESSGPYAARQRRAPGSTIFSVLIQTAGTVMLLSSEPSGSQGSPAGPTSSSPREGGGVAGGGSRAPRRSQPSP